MTNNSSKISPIIKKNIFLKNKKIAFKNYKILSKNTFTGLDNSGDIFFARYSNIAKTILTGTENSEIEVEILNFCVITFSVKYNWCSLKLGEFTLLPENCTEFEFLCKNITPREKIAKINTANSILNPASWYDRDVLKLYEDTGNSRLVRYLGSKASLKSEIELEDVETYQVLKLKLIDFMDKWLVCKY